MFIHRVQDKLAELAFKMGSELTKSAPLCARARVATAVKKRQSGGFLKHHETRGSQSKRISLLIDDLDMDFRGLRLRPLL